LRAVRRRGEFGDGSLVDRAGTTTRQEGGGEAQEREK